MLKTGVYEEGPRRNQKAHALEHVRRPSCTEPTPYMSYKVFGYELGTQTSSRKADRYVVDDVLQVRLHISNVTDHTRLM